MLQFVARYLGILLLTAGLISPAAGETSNGFDGFNGWTHDLNRGFAATVVKPVLNGARNLPAPLPEGLANAFANLTEPVSIFSHLIAGDPLAAAQSTLRFGVNSTIGIVGLIDVAAKLGLPVRKKHFSEAVCALGLPLSDRVIVLPLVGASSVSVAAVALVVMAGSTWGLALVSIDLAIAGALSDAIGAAAALENVGASGGDDEAAFRSYLAAVGC